MNYNNAVFEKAYATPEQLEVSDLPEFCFCGRSNVGKSSLINRVLGRKSIARVSSKPGKTITINFYRVDGLRLVDLPGYGYAKVPFAEKSRWSELMEHYFRSGRDIRMVFQLIDMRHPATDFDISMLEFLRHMNIPYTVILTKSDKLNKTETEKRLSLIRQELGALADGIDIIPFSSLRGTDGEIIRQIVENKA
ncbi:MAG: ribosome biogenesis GTP-binding protein YihA/YsxC [Acutalibacteraceae bacterium]|nr:YihA family ribosome biogenesis GTP-binding protein [Clostridia bacterium]MEE1330320.1 ribosome biogenesis GTP-binding protein YihA/YsxC [Acutalibacteraceae bacterium]